MSTPTCGITVTPMSVDELRAWNQAIDEAAATMDPQVTRLRDALALIERNEQEPRPGFSGTMVKGGSSGVGSMLRRELEDALERQNAIKALRKEGRIQALTIPEDPMLSIPESLAEKISDEIGSLLLQWSPDPQHADYQCAFCRHRPETNPGDIAHATDCSGIDMRKKLNAILYPGLPA